MEFIRFIDTGRHYVLEEISGDMRIEHLAFFLTDDIADDGSFFKEFLDDPTRGTTGGNYAYLDRVGKDKIIIGCEGLKYDVPIEEQGVFETTREQLHYIIDKWVELWHKHAKEILITRDGDKVTVEGKF